MLHKVTLKEVVMQATLRQQGGAAVLTVPMAILQQMGWQIGHKVNLETRGESVILTPIKRQARGRKTVAELLAGIDSQEVAELNTTVAEFTQSQPTGKEVW
ncbi:antitoxin [Glaesserella parasuis]|nr:antitoxin [Glaesserella parasuis]MDG6241814.1 antitoxin [Glaesserella parasuis]MDG6295038.1 antitoxin [Glaesserella parasuis]MDG6301397.1 antitoxin [Glaesserella parasuis]MDG6465248.1 antitoxin [Glaesserella parasuis]MDO9772011.1 antitoxin [Glaesserella parasuis]